MKNNLVGYPSQNITCFTLLSRGVDDFSEEDARFFGPLFVVGDCFGYLRMFCHFFLHSILDSLPL